MILALSEKINEKCLNNYSIQYSLSEDKRSREKILEDTIKSYAIC